jgi:hypothetical protein
MKLLLTVGVRQSEEYDLNALSNAMCRGLTSQCSDMIIKIITFTPRNLKNFQLHDTANWKVLSYNV